MISFLLICMLQAEVTLFHYRRFFFKKILAQYFVGLSYLLESQKFCNSRLSQMKLVCVFYSIYHDVSRQNKKQEFEKTFNKY